MIRVVVVSWFGPVLENVRTSINEAQFTQEKVGHAVRQQPQTVFFTKEQFKKNKVNVLERQRLSKYICIYAK